VKKDARPFPGATIRMMDPRGSVPGDGGAARPRRESVSIAVIIRRDLAPVAAHLRDEFSGLASLVAVIIDRRYRDRRRTEAAQPVERRHGERRQRNVSEQLRDGGWAVVPVDDTRLLR
jgi:hypothetical protein